MRLTRNCHSISLLLQQPFANNVTRRKEGKSGSSLPAHNRICVIFITITTTSTTSTLFSAKKTAAGWYATLMMIMTFLLGDDKVICGCSCFCYYYHIVLCESQLSSSAAPRPPPSTPKATTCHIKNGKSFFHSNESKNLALNQHRYTMIKK